MKDTTITSKDLNGIDYLNGKSSVSTKGGVVFGGKALKGALARYNGAFSQYDEIIFIQSMKRKLYEYQTERFEYKGLPKPLTKYRFERKLINSGSALFTKIGDMYAMLDYTMLKSDIYDEPHIVKVNEPKSVLNGRKFDLTKDINVMVVRNNESMSALYIDASRFILLMEKILYQIEKNITSSAPKGILNLTNSELAFEEDDENPEKESMETIINGQDTFYVLKSKAIENQEYGQNESDIFIPIELTDQTDKLLKNYHFAKEQLKELVGAEINSTSQKKERNVVDEVNEQGFATGSLQHAFNIRQVDIKNINERFSLNITMEYQSDDREEEEDKKEQEERGDFKDE